jgi:hypothetical protein
MFTLARCVLVHNVSLPHCLHYPHIHTWNHLGLTLINNALANREPALLLQERGIVL